MNLQKALDLTDEMRPNMMERNTKILFLTEIEQILFREILMKHEHDEDEEELPQYDADTDPGTELLAPDPYSMLYVYWLMTKIDSQNLEFDKYNNDRSMFENAYANFSDYWTREHMPLTAMPQFRL